jgi:hypothetical protein
MAGKYILNKTANIIRSTISKTVSWVWFMLCVGEKRSVYKELVEFVEGKEALGRIKPSWEDNMNKYS